MLKLSALVGSIQLRNGAKLEADGGDSECGGAGAGGHIDLTAATKLLISSGATVSANGGSALCTSNECLTAISPVPHGGGGAGGSVQMSHAATVTRASAVPGGGAHTGQSGRVSAGWALGHVGAVWHSEADSCLWALRTSGSNSWECLPAHTAAGVQCCSSDIVHATDQCRKVDSYWDAATLCRERGLAICSRAQLEAHEGSLRCATAPIWSHEQGAAMIGWTGRLTSS